MDKWLKRQSSKQQKPKKQQQQETQQNLKEEQDLQMALEESRLASDIEKAISLSLCDQYERDTPLPAPLPVTSAPAQLITSTKRPGSTSSAKSTRKRRHRTNTVSPAITTSVSSSSDTWAVETFVNDLLNQLSTTAPTSHSETDDEDAADLDGNSLASDMYDLEEEDATTSYCQQQGTDDDATTDDGDDTENPGPRTTNDNEDDDDWEIVDDDTEATSDRLQSPPKGKQHWHDEQAEDQFFGQFHRETWDKDQLRATYDATKKRSMATAIKKNKKKRTNSSITSDHNYYTMADDVLEEAFDAAGFGDSAAGLSWEGMGQSRYA